MKTMGELIDKIIAKEDTCLMALRFWVLEDADQELLEEFRHQPLNEQNIYLLCTAFAEVVRERLARIPGESHYMRTCAEAKQTLDIIFQVVEFLGIRREFVCVPVSITDMMVCSGLVTVVSGTVSLTAEGEEVARKIDDGTVH